MRATAWLGAPAYTQGPRWERKTTPSRTETRRGGGEGAPWGWVGPGQLRCGGEQEAQGNLSGRGRRVPGPGHTKETRSQRGKLGRVHPCRPWGIPRGAASSEDLSPGLESTHCRFRGPGKATEGDGMAITAAALVGLGTRRRRRRSLPANVPLTKRRRRQRRPCPSRDPTSRERAEPVLEA